jgi:hypothetical protein
MCRRGRREARMAYGLDARRCTTVNPALELKRSRHLFLIFASSIDDALMGLRGWAGGIW